MNDRYLAGVEQLQRSGIAGAESISSRVAELAPDFARMAIEFPYGDLYARDQLAPKQRELIAVAALAAQGNAAPQLRRHVTAALHLGWSRTELVEALTQVSVHAGFPAAMNALAGCHDLLAEGGCTPCQSAALGVGQR